MKPRQAPLLELPPNLRKANGVSQHVFMFVKPTRAKAPTDSPSSHPFKGAVNSAALRVYQLGVTIDETRPPGLALATSCEPGGPPPA
jgi:hypothetical protein